MEHLAILMFVFAVTGEVARQLGWHIGRVSKKMIASKIEPSSNLDEVFWKPIRHIGTLVLITAILLIISLFGFTITFIIFLVKLCFLFF